MSTLKKTMNLALAIVLALSIALLAGCGSDEPTGASSDAGTASDSGYTLLNDGKLSIGSDCDYPPFIALDAAGNPEGFEYDLMVAVAEEMGLEVEYIAPQAFDTLIAQVVAGGKMDIAVSSFTITPERAEQIDFTNPYFLDGVDQAISSLKDSGIAGRDDLAGKKVAVQSGTTGQDWAEENLPGAEIVPYTNITDAFNAMMAGKVDACVNDLPAAEKLISESFQDISVVESVPMAEEYGIVVSKENPALTEALNDALAKVKDSGKYDEIYKKWFEDAE